MNCLTVPTLQYPGKAREVRSPTQSSPTTNTTNHSNTTGTTTAEGSSVRPTITVSQLPTPVIHSSQPASVTLQVLQPAGTSCEAQSVIQKPPFDTPPKLLPVESHDRLSWHCCSVTDSMVDTEGPIEIATQQHSNQRGEGKSREDLQLIYQKADENARKLVRCCHLSLRWLTTALTRDAIFGREVLCRSI